MEETFSFRLLCGKGSRSGHIRKEEKQTEILNYLYNNNFISFASIYIIIV